MSRPEIVVDFESHRGMMNGLTISQVYEITEIILRINALDDASFALLRAVLSGSFQDPDRETDPDSRA